MSTFRILPSGKGRERIWRLEPMAGQPAAGQITACRMC